MAIGRGRWGPEADPTEPSPGLVAFLFGVANRQEVPGPVLVRLLADCGASEAAARSLLARMRRAGALESRRVGRVGRYRLAGVTADAFHRGARRSGDETPASGGGDETPGSGPGGEGVWDGAFHGVLHTVPERHRPFRDALRRLTRLAGYGTLHPGLSIAIRDGWPRIAEAMGPVPEGAWVAPVRLELDAQDARAAVRIAWDLDRAATVRAGVVAALEAAASGPEPPADGEGVRAYARLARPAYESLVHDPGLPVELTTGLDRRDDLLAALGAATARYRPPLEAYLSELLAPWDGPGVR